MSIPSTAERPDARRGRWAVPWSTVVPLAVGMAYADGFWMMSLRGAVGAIERTGAPFANWLQESTLVLPVFVFAVLGAVTLALRWFGPALDASRTFQTALLIVGAGTVAGTAAIAASAAYDYSLQSRQLQLTGQMSHTCALENCTALKQQASLALGIEAVGYASGILVVTNLVLVGWILAVRGGRLDITRTRRRPARPVGGLRQLLAAGLLGSAMIHAAVVPAHGAEWAAAGVFFSVLAAGELAIAVLLLVRAQPAALLAAAVFSSVPLAVWLYSRTLGIPFGPEAGVPEQIGLADCAACALELATLLTAVVLLRGKGRLGWRPAMSAHVSWLSLTAVIAVTALGFAASGYTGFGSSGETVMEGPPAVNRGHG